MYITDLPLFGSRKTYLIGKLTLLEHKIIPSWSNKNSRTGHFCR